MEGFPSPPIRVYGNEKVIIFSSEAPRKDAKINSDAVDCMLDLAKRRECQTIISVDGVPGLKVNKQMGKAMDAIMKNPIKVPKLLRMESKDIREKHTKDDFGKIHYITNAKKHAETLFKSGCQFLENAFVPGVTGFLLQKMNR
eukprot:UN06665